MVYTKTVWKDRVVQNPLTFTVPSTITPGTPFTLSPAEGVITDPGTAITAAALNKLETQYDEVFNTLATFGHYHSNLTNNSSVSASTDTLLMPNTTTGSPLIDASGNFVVPSDGVYAIVLSVAVSGVAANTRIDLRMFKGTVAGGPASIVLSQILAQHINPTASGAPIVLGATIPKLLKNDVVNFYINPSASVTVVGGTSRLNIIKLT